MNAKITYYEATRKEVEDREGASKQEMFFKAMVDEVCDEYEDYENVLKRVQYLEKYRSEYYFNV